MLTQQSNYRELTQFLYLRAGEIVRRSVPERMRSALDLREENEKKEV